MSEPRARAINPSVLKRLNSLYDEQKVVVRAKNVFQSVTMVVNGFLFIVASAVMLLDIIFGSNIVEPIVQVFTEDPEVATRTITTMTQIYTVLNILLRIKTSQPVTLKTETK